MLTRDFSTLRALLTHTHMCQGATPLYQMAYVTLCLVHGKFHPQNLVYAHLTQSLTMPRPCLEQLQALYGT